jgi:antitoxin YefM
MRSAAVDVKTFSEARANLKAVMDTVTKDHMPVIISRRKAEPVVMISLATWNSMNETAFLRSNPERARRLSESIAEADRGEFVDVELGEDGLFHEVPPR